MTAALLWARGEIRRGWLSLLAVALLTALAGGVVMAGVAGARRAGASVDRYLADTGLADATIYTQDAPEPALLADLATDVRVEDVAQLRVAVAAPRTLEPGIDGATLVVPNEYWGDRVNFRVVEGVLPVGTAEIAMAEQARLLSGLDVGDSVEMQLLTLDGLRACFDTGACDPTSVGHVTITAIVRMPDDLAPGPFGQAVFIAPEAFLDSRGGEASALGHITDVFLRPGTDIDGFVADYSIHVADGDVTNASQDDLVGARRAADLQHDSLLIGSLIAAVAGLLISGQAYGRCLARRSSDAPALLALGMPAGQRTLAGWLPGTLAAVVGAGSSVPVAIALSPLLPLRMARRADPDVGIHADLVVLVVGVLAILVISATAAAMSSSLWSRATFAGSSTTMVSAVARVCERLGLGPGSAMGLRFAFERGRGPRRVPVVSALIGATAAITVVVGALVLSASLDGLLGSPARYGAPWDMLVRTGDETEEVAGRIVSDERVDSAAEARVGELNLAANGDQPVQVFAVGMTSIKGSLEPVILDGRSASGPDEAVLGSNSFERLGVKIGDRLTASGPTGSQQVTIVGRAIEPIIGSSFTDEGIVVPIDTFASLGAAELVGDVDAEVAVLVRGVDGAASVGLRRDFEGAGLIVDPTFRQSSVTALGDIRAVPVLVAEFTALLGAFATFNVLVVTARRRRSDLAVMRALGSRPRQAGGVISWQGVAIAVAALATGIPLGLIGGRALWRTVATRTNVLGVIDSPPMTIGFVAVAVVAVAGVLAGGPAWSAQRRRPATDLRTE